MIVITMSTRKYTTIIQISIVSVITIYVIAKMFVDGFLEVTKPFEGDDRLFHKLKNTIR